MRKAARKSDSRTVPPGAIYNPLVAWKRCTFNAPSRTTFHPIRAPNIKSEEAIEKYVTEYDSDTWEEQSDGCQRLLDEWGEKLLSALLNFR